MHHDKYSAYLVVCQRGGGFAGDVTSTLLNLAPEGGLTQHLAIQQAMLPALFTASLCVCVCVLAMLVLISFSIIENVRRVRNANAAFFTAVVQRVTM